MTNLFTVGIFNVRVVDVGDFYGNGVVNSYNEPLIIFYDNRFVRPDIGWVYGQQISSYLISTILNRDPKYGLNLDGGVKDWSVSVAEMKQVYFWLNEYLLQTVEF